MEFVKVYKVFNHESGVIWKIEELFIPKNDVEHWTKEGSYLTKEDLKINGIKL